MSTKRNSEIKATYDLITFIGYGRDGDGDSEPVSSSLPVDQVGEIRWVSDNNVEVRDIRGNRTIDIYIDQNPDLIQDSMKLMMYIREQYNNAKMYQSRYYQQLK